MEKKLSASQLNYNRRIRKNNEDLDVMIQSIELKNELQYFPVCVSLATYAPSKIKATPIHLALKDTGCSNTCIRKDTFEALEGAEKVTIRKTERKVRSALNKVSALHGLVTLNIALTGSNPQGKKETVHVSTDAYIVEGLSHPLILGQDVLVKHEQLSSKTHSYFTKSARDLSEYPDTSTLYEVTRTCVKIPYIKKSTTQPTVHCDVDFWLPANTVQVKSLAIRAPHSLEAWIGHPVAFCHSETLPGGAIIPSTYTVLQKLDNMDIAICNPTDQPIFFPAKTCMGYLFPLAVHNEVNSMECKPSHEWSPSTNDLITSFNRVLDKNEITDSAERSALVSEYLKTGSVCLPLNEQHIEGEEVLEPKTRERSTEELLSAIQLDHLSDQMADKIRSLFGQYPEVLQRHKYHFHRSKSYAASFEMKEIKVPLIQKQPPISPQVVDEVYETLQAMEKAGVIQECKEAAPIISSLLVTKKKDGSPRILYDARHVNALTVKRQNQPIFLDQVYDAMGKASHVSSLDLSNAFFSIPVERKYCRFLAFQCPKSHKIMMYRSLPQGHINSCFHLQQYMTKVLQGLEDFCILYVDDCLIYTKGSLEDHIKVLEKVIQRFIEYGLLVKPEKLNICKLDFEFLGVTFQLKGQAMAKIPDYKIRGYLDQERPKTKKALLSFLASVSYYRRFVPHFSDLTCDLHSLAIPGPGGKPSEKINWTPDLSDKYDRILQAIQQHSVIACPDTSKPFVAFSDASDKCASFLLFQADKQDRLRLVAAISKAFSKSQVSSHIYKKECAALQMGLSALQYYLRFCTGITIYSDARGLACGILSRATDPALTRKLMFISSFPVTIKHVSSVGNAMADHLSRYHRHNPVDKEQQERMLCTADAIKLVQAIQFPNVTFTASDIERMLAESSPVPAPMSKQTPVGLLPARKFCLERKKMIPSPRPLRKIKMPAMRVNRTLQKQMERQFHDQEPQDLPASEEEETPPGNPEPADPTFAPFMSDQDKTYIKMMLQPNFRRAKKVYEDQARTLLQAEAATIELNSILEETPANWATQQRTSYKCWTGNPALAKTVETLNPCRFRPMTENDIFYTIPDDTTIEANLVGIIPEPIQGPRAKQSITIESPEQVEFCCNDSEQDLDCDHTTSVATFTALATVPHKNAMTKEDFQGCQQRDPFINDCIKEIERNEQSPYLKVDGIYCHKKRNGTTKILLPKTLLTHLVSMYHYHFGNHTSATKIYDTIAIEYHRPHLKKDIFALIRNCALCTVNKPSSAKTLQGTFEVVKEPRIKYGMDFIPNLREVDGYRNILVVVDHASQLLRLFPTRDRRPHDIIQALRFIQQADATTIPYLRSDGEGALNSKEFKNFLHENGIHLDKTAANSPQSNSLAEHQVHDVKKQLLSLNKTFPDSWPYFLPMIALAHNKTCSARLGITPEMYHFGNTSPTPMTLVHFEKPWTVQSISKQRHAAAEKRERMVRSFTKEEDLHRIERRKAFKPGMVVVVLKTKQQRMGPFETRYQGPYLIESVAENGYTANLISLGERKIRRKAHMNHLKPVPNEYNNVLQRGSQLPVHHEVPETSSETVPPNDTIPPKNSKTSTASKNNKL